MPSTALAGTRIRERRLLAGMRQADLAREIGVSPSYLNLIEHNRRRAGPRLIEAAARVLGVDVSALTEGAEAALLDALRDAAALARGDPEPEAGRVEEFVGRFPGWAALLAAEHRRAGDLERTVERLTDRMAHDPYLSTALHEMLSAVTSLRSTAAILSETEDLPPHWRRKFHDNLHGDSVRLAEGARALAGYLDTAADDDRGAAAPQEELEAWLRARDYHVAELEEPRANVSEDALIAAAPELASNSARALARRYLRRYRAEARALPQERLVAALAAHGPDPGVLAAQLGQPVPLVFRRLASLPPESEGLPPVGLVMCDGSGTLVFRKPVAGFAFPRFGGACPIWPLFQTLSQPLRPVHCQVEMGTRPRQLFDAYAVCEPVGPTGFGAPQVLEASMLILPVDAGSSPGQAPLAVGVSCRICERTECPARREPSILVEGF
ncbi:XRE family transcriptional regulator [Rhodobacteraceae bacterium WD3A24]|nr:XRE family transcriptional regulator [Rhodobacteraceae bacterium WD3A24]